jgi:hypothetical protein
MITAAAASGTSSRGLGIRMRRAMASVSHLKEWHTPVGCAS